MCVYICIYGVEICLIKMINRKRQILKYRIVQNTEVTPGDKVELKISLDKGVYSLEKIDILYEHENYPPPIISTYLKPTSMLENYYLDDKMSTTKKIIFDNTLQKAELYFEEKRELVFAGEEFEVPTQSYLILESEDLRVKIKDLSKPNYNLFDIIIKKYI